MAPIFAFWGTCKRGSATAVYDYANHGERLLGLNRPLIICLGIPQNATVFCRHGGTPTFNIPFVKAAVAQHAGDEPSAWFLFMNTARFVKEHPRVRFLAPETDDAAKSRFIRSCDAMLHARREGETFGLAIAEFSAHNRPVITSSAHDDRGRARHHLDTLGKRGLYYDSKESLLRLLRTFDRTAARTGDWRAYTQYAPEVVMQTFRRVFLEAPCLPASGVGE